MAVPRVVVVRRETEYSELLARHGTRGQVEFFLAGRGRDLQAVEQRHRQTADALADVSSAIPLDWRRAVVERAELTGFVFGPEDLIVVVGQDGLVANVAKYLDGQPVIGVDPLPAGNPGVLVPHRAAAVPGLLRGLVAGDLNPQRRTMVTVTADDGQQLTALNEIYLGQPGHSSARYRIRTEEKVERQSSSGVIIGTGTGATGWCASLQRVQAPRMIMPDPENPRLVWFVREAWPSPATGAELISGTIDPNGELLLEVESDQLVAFGDGIESDRLNLVWGQRLSARRAERVLRTVG